MSNFPPEKADTFAAGKDTDGPSPAESLVLLKAFMRIKDASQRRTVIDLVEKMVAGEGK